MKKSLGILLFGLLAFPAVGQEEAAKPLRRNNISVAPMVIIDRTIPLSYSRYLNEQRNFTFYARYRIGRDDHTIYEGGLFSGMDYNHPHIYSRVYIRSGLQFLKNKFMTEPLLQLDRGWLRDRGFVIVPSEGSGDKIEVQDRDYYSAGIIVLVGSYNNGKIVRSRIFCGFGLHVKYFQVHAKSGWGYDPENSPTFPYYEEYFKLMPSFHLGLEIGLNF